MSESMMLSRRNAAMVIAGTFVTSGSATAAYPHRNDGNTTVAANEREARDSHRRITDLLRDVRRANGSAARTHAFERCKAALRQHASCAASIVAGKPHDRNAASAGAGTLYRYADPSMVLANVIVRELDTLGPSDKRWLPRFADLEAAFAAHSTLV